MATSLVIDSVFELIGTAVNPEYRLVYNFDAAFDRGYAAPDTTEIAQMLDGSAVVGDRSLNRQISLPIQVRGASRSDIDAKIDALLQLVNQPGFTLQWTPDGGLPIVYECYRGHGIPKVTQLEEIGFLGAVLLQFSARPFGRSADLTYITLDAGSAAQIQLDSMDSGVYSGAVEDTTVKFEGTGSAKIGMSKTVRVIGGASLESYSASSVRRSLAAPVDLTGYASFGLRFRWPPPRVSWGVLITLSLESAGVTVASGQRHISVVYGDTRWRRIVVPIDPTWDVSAVDRWVVDIQTSENAPIGYPTNRTPNRPDPSYCWIDDLRAYPLASTVDTTAEGAVVTIPSVEGSARSPVNFAFTMATPMTGIVVHRPPSDQDADLEILASLGGASSHTVSVAAENARYDGTYTPLLLASNKGSGDRHVDLTITQLVDGVTVATKVVSKDFVTADMDGFFLPLDDVTLPLVRIPDDCTTCTFTFAVATTSSATNATWFDLMLLDTYGPTIRNGVLPTNTLAVYYDEPTVGDDLGHVYASTSDRSAAFSILGDCDLTGGPMSHTPGENRLLVVTPEGLPDIATEFYSRWLDTRVV